MKPPTTRTELTSVGRGTPMGELLRRYWHPIGLGSDATEPQEKSACSARIWSCSATARPARPAARALLPPRHHALLRQGRGSRHPLLLPRLEIRHRRPLPRTTLRARWRPVQGQGAAALVSPAGAYGLIFAYLGPAEKQPVLPRYQCLEKMDDGEFVEADTVRPSAAAVRPSSPATGCSISKTWSTPITSRCCMDRFPGRNSPIRWPRCRR